MANANLALITTANTFMDWLNLTDNEANSINELRNGNYYKDNGNFTVANGSVLIITPSGTTLSVTANALISGYLTAGNLSITQNLSVTGGTNVANINIAGTMNASYEAITNTNNSPIVNVAILNTPSLSNQNIASWQLLSPSNTSAQLVLGANGQIINSNANASGNTFRIHNHWDGNVYFAVGQLTGDLMFFTQSANLVLRLDASGNTNVSGNLLVAQNVATGNAKITQNTSTGNLSVTQNSTTGNLSVTQNSTTGNLSVTQNSTTGNLQVTTLANIGSVNVSTSFIDEGTAIFAGTLPGNVAALPSVVLGGNLNNNNFFVTMNCANSGANNGNWQNYAANSNASGVNTGSLVFRTGSDNQTTFNNWLQVNRANINVTQIIIGNGNDNPQVNVIGSLNVSGAIAAGGISAGNTGAGGSPTQVMYNQAGLLVGNGNLTFTANSTLAVNGNVTVTQNSSTGNITVTQNTATGNVSVTQNTATGNVKVTQNSSTGNITVTQNVVCSQAANIVQPILVATRELLVNAATINSPNTYTVDVSTASDFDITLGNTQFNSVNITFTNWAQSGNLQTVVLILRQPGATGNTAQSSSNIATWVNTSILWSNGEVPVLAAFKGKADILTFTTVDGGNKVYGAHSMANVG